MEEAATMDPVRLMARSLIHLEAAAACRISATHTTEEVEEDWLREGASKIHTHPPMVARLMVAALMEEVAPAMAVEQATVVEPTAVQATGPDMVAQLHLHLEIMVVAGMEAPPMAATVVEPMVARLLLDLRLLPPGLLVSALVISQAEAVHHEVVVILEEGIEVVVVVAAATVEALMVAIEISLQQKKYFTLSDTLASNFLSLSLFVSITLLYR